MMAIELIGNKKNVKPINNDNLVNTELYNLITPEIYSTRYSLNIMNILPNGFVKTQSHKEEHGVFIISGKGNILLGEEWFDVRKGSYVFIPSGMVHSFKNSGIEPMEVLILKI